MTPQANIQTEPNNVIQLPKQVTVDTPLTSAPAPAPATPHCKVTVGQWTVRGKSKWYVRFPKDGKPSRANFDSKPEAEAFAAEQRGHGMTNKQRLLTLPPGDQNLLLAIYDDAHKRGIALSRVLGSVGGLPIANKVVPGIGAVIAALITEKETNHADEGYVKNLRQSLNKFAKGREIMPIDAFTTEMVEEYFAKLSIGYKKTLRPKISGLFHYACRKKYIVENPCTAMARISKTALKKNKKIHVFTIDEAEKCLKWLVKNPKGLAWFIKTAFAGLRPQDEACLTGWECIDFKRQCIVVEAEVVKTGDRRVCYPPKMVFDWLQWAKDHGSELPLTLCEVVTVQRKLRKVLGGVWEDGWKQDVTRHSAATYQLAMTKDVNHVSRSLGHSVYILETTYDAKKLEHEGVDYYALTVDKIVK